jgi:hypothetical protein
MDQSEDCPFSNWVGSFTNAELRRFQLEDPCIGVVLSDKESNNQPTKQQLKDADPETKTLFSHWELLIV